LAEINDCWSLPVLFGCPEDAKHHFAIRRGSLMALLEIEVTPTDLLKLFNPSVRTFADSDVHNLATYLRSIDEQFLKHWKDLGMKEIITSMFGGAFKVGTGTG
jgi:hypothetical protein